MYEVNVFDGENDDCEYLDDEVLRDDPDLMRERRSSERKVLRLRADVRFPDNKTLQTHSVDISTGGICLVSPVKLDLGQTCEINLQLSACGSDTTVPLLGRVCYCIRGADGFRAGMQFVQMSSQASAVIEAALK